MPAIRTDAGVIYQYVDAAHFRKGLSYGVPCGCVVIHVVGHDPNSSPPKQLPARYAIP
jgi:hypothetical protein